jgi:uncharacterized RDD family membrane protein YckC
MSSFERSSYSDQLNIDTPEQVELQYNIAGVGSRFVAALLDYLIQVSCYLLEILLFVLIASGAAASGAGKHNGMDTAAKWFVAILIFLNFAFFVGYFALFEAYWRGQTPGKRVMKLRVLKDSGRQITLFEALARNLIRVIDYMPSMYLVGVITMLCNKGNKRLGDLAAGTIVVHERLDEQSLLYQTSTTLVAPVSFASQPWAPAQGALAPWAKPVAAMFPADAVAKLSAQDLIVIEAFFARMLDLPMETRAAVAYRMAAQMAAKMGVPVPEGNPERMLEAIAFQMRGSGRAF